jgi:hypothetical protein
MALLADLVGAAAAGRLLADLEQQIKDMLEVVAWVAVLDKEILVVVAVVDQ